MAQPERIIKEFSMSEKQNSKPYRCIKCGAEFHCGIAAGETTCWCMEKPVILPVPEDEATGCYCPACLEKASQEYNQNGALFFSAPESKG